MHSDVSDDMSQVVAVCWLFLVQCFSPILIIAILIPWRHSYEKHEACKMPGAHIFNDSSRKRDCGQLALALSIVAGPQ